MPHLILQPLVENAIHHGVARSAQQVRVEVRARRDGGRLVLQVKDDGPGMQATGKKTQSGIGLRNTRARLRQLYGAGGRLTLWTPEPRGVCAEISLPYHTTPVSRRQTEAARPLEAGAYDAAL